MAKRTSKKVKNTTRRLKTTLLTYTRPEPSWSFIVSFWNDTEQKIFEVFDAIHSWKEVLKHVKKAVGSSKSERFISKISLARHNAEDGFKMPSWLSNYISCFKINQFPRIYEGNSTDWISYCDGVFDAKTMYDKTYNIKTMASDFFAPSPYERDMRVC
jgi:hypothetical protein